MKKLFALSFVLFFAIFGKAQNVAINNDGSNADSSAILDVKSNTKGLLMPRMTTVQRQAIAKPAMGLMVYDTDTKSGWSFNGTGWVNSATSSIIFPYQQFLDTTVTALELNNTVGTAILATSNAGKAIEAKNSSSTQPAILAYNQIGKSVFAGSGSDDGIYGLALVGGKAGVHGYSNTVNGIGVFGEVSQGTGVQGSSTIGTAVKASSINGYALVTTGKVKIAGGNTNPSKGAVLTSDSVGNATWKQPIKSAFAASSIVSDVNTRKINVGTAKALTFKSKTYDLSNNFSLATPGATGSTFVAPVDGIYHFDAGFEVGFSPGNNGSFYGILRLLIQVDAVGLPSYNCASANAYVLRYTLGATCSGDAFLKAGNIVSAKAYYSNSNLVSYNPILTEHETNYFNGRLVLQTN